PGAHQRYLSQGRAPHPEALATLSCQGDGLMSALYRSALPQLEGSLFLTDGGIETSLIFNDGLDLPHFAAIALLERPEGEAALRSYFAAYAAIAARHGTGLVLEAATWRASADWGARIG